MYWFISNLWTMGQQFLVIREMPTPGSEAAKAREERLARKGKALDSSGKVVPSQEGAPRVVLDGPGLAYTC